MHSGIVPNPIAIIQAVSHIKRCHYSDIQVMRNPRPLQLAIRGKQVINIQRSANIVFERLLNNLLSEKE